MHSSALEQFGALCSRTQLAEQLYIFFSSFILSKTPQKRSHANTMIYALVKSYIAIEISVIDFLSLPSE